MQTIRKQTACAAAKKCQTNAENNDTDYLRNE